MATMAWTGSFTVTAPTFTNGNLIVACPTNGQLLRLGDDGQLTSVVESNGRPTAACTDPNTQDVFLADAARQAVVKSEGPATQFDAGSAEPPHLAQFLEQFEGQPFNGPTGIAIDAAGEVFFSDGGAFGDTGLHNPKGAVYRTVQNRQQVVPLCPPSLAFPTGIACSSSGAVYVCELHANRVLRFVQRPQGVYHGSVFVQLSGGVGPMAIAVNPRTDEVYIAKHEFAPASADTPMPEGAIVVMQPNGVELGTIPLPEGPEISGLCFDPSGQTLYITERTRIFTIPTSILDGGGK